jgi:MoaA/NifB/PqqE/SkfB family radical SAM enzyme
MKLKRYFDVLQRTRFGTALPFAGLWNYAKYFFVRRKEIMTPSLLAPVLATLFVTSRCNLKCSFCTVGKAYQSTETPWQELEMSPDFVKHVLQTEALRRTMVVILSGGEPLLNKDIFGIIKTIKASKRQCAMITNGTLLKDNLSQMIDAGIDEIQVSIYDNTIERLEPAFSGICRSFNINASYVLLRTTLENHPGAVERAIRFCQDSGCHSLKLNICQPAYGSTSETIFDDHPLFDDFVAKMKATFPKFNIHFPAPVSRTLRSPREKRCLMPWQQIYVNGRGDISMCCNHEVISPLLGYSINAGIQNRNCPNVFAESDLNSYNAPVYQEIRHGLLNNTLTPSNFCQTCMHLTGKSFAARL